MEPQNQKIHQFYDVFFFVPNTAELIAEIKG
jgi:hypothetical protein